MILNLRYALQYFMIENSTPKTAPLLALIIVLAISDFVPITCLIACI